MLRTQIEENHFIIKFKIEKMSLTFLLMSWDEGILFGFLRTSLLLLNKHIKLTPLKCNK